MPLMCMGVSTHACIYVYAYICVCVCGCAYVHVCGVFAGVDTGFRKWGDPGSC